MYRSIYDDKRKQWQGLKMRPLYNPEVTLGEVLLKSMHINGSKIAQVSFQHKYPTLHRGEFGCHRGAFDQFSSHFQSIVLTNKQKVIKQTIKK